MLLPRVKNHRNNLDSVSHWLRLDTSAKALYPLPWKLSEWALNTWYEAGISCWLNENLAWYVVNSIYEWIHTNICFKLVSCICSVIFCHSKKKSAELLRTISYETPLTYTPTPHYVSSLIVATWVFMSLVKCGDTWYRGHIFACIINTHQFLWFVAVYAAINHKYWWVCNVPYITKTIPCQFIDNCIRFNSRDQSYSVIQQERGSRRKRFDIKTMQS